MSFNFSNITPPVFGLAIDSNAASLSAQLKPATTLKKPDNAVSTLPIDVLKHCVCHFCNCYVNVAPVRFISNRVACGRCLAPSDGVRLFMVEALTRMHNFPCRYEKLGCPEFLVSGSVESHEKACNYKQVRCLIENCTWDGTKNGIKPHFEEVHKTEIINAKTSVVLNLKEARTHYLLYTMKNVPYIVTIFTESEVIKHSIRSFCTDLEAMRFYYDIKFSANFRDLTFNKQKVQSYDHDNAISNETIPITLLSSVFGDTYKVHVFINVKSNLIDTSKLEDISMTDIECPVCMDPMLEQIYIRKCGHSVCGVCSTNLRDSPCPVCRSTPAVFDGFGNQSRSATPNTFRARNYSLERIIRKVNTIV